MLSLSPEFHAEYHGNGYIAYTCEVPACLEFHSPAVHPQCAIEVEGADAASAAHLEHVKHEPLPSRFSAASSKYSCFT